MMTEEIKAVKEEFYRIKDLMKNSKPGTTEYHELRKDFDSLFGNILNEDKAGTERELKEAEFELKLQEANKPFFKKLEFWGIAASVATGLLQVGGIIKAETGGAILNSRAFSFVHKPRSLK